MDIYDPVASSLEVQQNLNIKLTNLNNLGKYDSILRLVTHDEFSDFDYDKYKKNNGIIFDLKGDLSGYENFSL